MKKDPKIFLGHILDSIEEIEKHMQGLDRQRFSETTLVQDAVIRRLEIIGEAVKNLPMAFRQQHSEINWKEIAGTRDTLIHEYFGISIKIIWKTFKEDLPKLKKQILNLIGKM